MLATTASGETSARHARRFLRSFLGSLLWGSICHHVEWEASRFIPSMLYAIDEVAVRGVELLTRERSVRASGDLQEQDTSLSWPIASSSAFW